MWVQSLGQVDLLEEGLATHSGIFAWKIPWIEEPGGHSLWVFYIYVSLYNKNFGCFPAVYSYIAKYEFTTFFHSLT